MAISRFKTSSIAQKFPKSQKVYDSTVYTPVNPPISGYKLWLDAADTSTITSSGSAVTQWADKSGNGYVFTQGTSGRRPSTGVNTLNNKNVLTYDGVDDGLISTATSSTWNFFHNGSSYTVFSVFKPRVIDNSKTYGVLSTNWNGSSANKGFNLGMAPGASTQEYNYFIPQSGGVYNIANQGGVLEAITTIRTDVIQPGNSSASRWNLYINNGALAQYNQRSSGTSTADADFTLQVGAAYDASTGSLDGYLAEILVYQSVLSVADRLSVTTYLNTKWGVY